MHSENCFTVGLVSESLADESPLLIKTKKYNVYFCIRKSVEHNLSLHKLMESKKFVIKMSKTLLLNNFTTKNLVLRILL